MMKLISSAFLFLLISNVAMANDGKPKPMSSHDRYIAGGIVGTVLGFGVGHAIQDRYGDKGWIFTVTESVGVALIIVGAVVPMPSAASTALIVVGALDLAAFKIWEIVDVWTGPMPKHAEFLPDLIPQHAFADAPPTRLGFTVHF